VVDRAETQALLDEIPAARAPRPPCRCPAIMAADPLRHFRGCERRASLPEGHPEADNRTTQERAIGSALEATGSWGSPHSAARSIVNGDGDRRQYVAMLRDDLAKLADDGSETVARRRGACERAIALIDSLPDVQPRRWAEVEIMGNRRRVGRVSEATLAGAGYLRVEALRSDGTFEEVLYSQGAVFSVTPRTEAEARRAAVAKGYQPCDAFKRSLACSLACERCGYELAAHDAQRERCAEVEADGDDDGQARSPAVAEQPPPVATGGGGVWQMVADDAAERFADRADLPAILADMAARDALGRQRYGTPLQAHNGRDALADAYQEALDLAVYLRQHLAEGHAWPAERRRAYDAALDLAVLVRGFLVEDTNREAGQ
jgi:hypothetical protein